NPLKVLMPPALWLVAIGFVKGVTDMFRHAFYFPANTVMIFLSGLLIGAVALLADLIVRSRGE
ncbi:MAG: glycosyltransferase family 2 protein, partial [Nonomuraea sp.]|nr:glycosyltransferase family 2 protein [Nonomuraea sp.]